MLPATIWGVLVSAVWNGLTQNEEKNSKLKEELSASVSQNQTKIDRYISEYKNSSLAPGNQSLSCDIEKKVYEVEVYQSPLKDNNSLALGVCSDEINDDNLEAASSERGPLKDLVGAAHKLGILIYKIVIGDWSHSKKTRILQIESAKNTSSSLSLDSNQIANLVKDISEKKIGELAAISSDQSLISSVSNSILITCNQAYLTFSKSLNEIFTIKNPFSFRKYPQKEEFKKSLKDQIPFNQTRFDNFINQYANRTEFNNGTDSTPAVDEYPDQAKVDEIFDRLVKSSTIKLRTEPSLTSDVYKNLGRIAAFTVVFGGLLCILYKTICQQRKNKTLKKFKLFSKKALIHHRFEKIQKENLKAKELKQQAEVNKSSLSVSEINIERLPSLQKTNVEIIKGKRSSTSNEFLRALQDVKKLFELDVEPLNLSKIYQFIVL